MKKGHDYTGVTIVFACHDGEGRYLFAKRNTLCRDEHGTWDPGGGGLEFGDTIEGTLRKEIYEEYRTEIRSFEFLGYRDVHREHDGNKTHWVALDFRVHIDPTKVENGEPHKHDEIRWFTIDSLPSPTHSQWPVFLGRYRDKLV